MIHGLVYGIVHRNGWTPTIISASTTTISTTAAAIFAAPTTISTTAAFSRVSTRPGIMTSAALPPTAIVRGAAVS